MSYKQVTIFENDVKIKSSTQPSVYGKGDLEVEGDTLLRGNLTVQGIQSDHQVDTFIVEDNIIAIGQPPITAGTDGGILISRHIDDITSGKVAESGTAQGGSASTITLSLLSNSTNGYYINWYIKITAGPGVGEKKVITAYNGATKIATIDSAWITIPTVASTYNLYSKARIGFIWNETVDEAEIVGTVDTHTAENITVNTYCDLHVQKIIQEQKQQCIYYVGKHGNNNDSGRHINEAKLTFNAALTAAAIDLPSSTNKIVIVCTDSCIYTENISIPSWVHVTAPNATLSGTIILASDSSVKFGSQEISAGTAITHSNGFAIASIDILVLTGTANGLSNSGLGTQLKFENKNLSVVNGTAISNSATGIGYLSAILCDVLISGTGQAIFVAAGAITNLHANQISGTGTALSVSGILNGHISKVACTTAYNVSGTNNLFVGDISGTELTIGTSNRIEAGVLTSKGDLLTRTATEYIRQPVGANTYVLTADSSQSTGLIWTNPAVLPTSKLATYTLFERNITVSNIVNFVTISYFPWLNSRYNGYTNGVLVLYVKIVDKDIELRFRDVTNGVTLHSPDPFLFTTSGSKIILLNANPISDASIELQVRKTSAGGVNPEILGCVLEYYT